MLGMNVVYPHFASAPLVTRMHGTITIRSVTTSSMTELGGSRVLRERSVAHADATLEAATVAASDALKAVASAGSAAVQAGLAAAAAAASSVAQQQRVTQEPAGQAAQQAQEVASAPAMGAGGEEAQQPWPRPKSDAPRRRVPSLLPAWHCSEEGANFTAATQDSRYWLSSSQYVAHYNASVPKYQWCRGAPPSLVPQLARVLLARSGKRRAARGVTLVTQLSVERFAMLENQCRSWPHAISAALYVPTLGGRVFSAEDRGWNKAPLDAAIQAVGRGGGVQTNIPSLPAAHNVPSQPRPPKPASWRCGTAGPTRP